MSVTEDTSVWARIKRKSIEQPFVTAGSLLTCAALVSAMYYLRQGNRNAGNIMFRYRIAAQGFTILALLGYGYMDLVKKKQKALEENVAQAQQAAAANEAKYRWDE
ncbi:Respiratory supercomplex factor 1, mitochondrial [Dimargaris xerosporica]|nr:Respiratory supercomplex factor 1, mitochondrial [Dimargaris xerosporica]